MEKEFEFEIIDGAATITAYNGKEKNVVIPAEIEGYPVIGVAELVFEGLRRIKSVTIPKSVTKIGEFAFVSCSSVKSVYYLGTVENWCAIEFGNSFANPLQFGATLYIDDKPVTALVIPDSVKRVNPVSFYGCGSVSSVEFGVGVTEFGGYAFDNCKNLSKVYYRGKADDWCKITFDGGEANPLCNGASLYFAGESVGEITVPVEIARLNPYAFYNCKSLNSVKLCGIIELCDGAFCECDGLTLVELGDKVERIGKFAFSGCAALEKITLAASVTQIGRSAFKGNKALTIYAAAKTKPVDWDVFWNYDNSFVYWGYEGE